MVAGFDADDADPFDTATVRAMVAAVNDEVRVRGVEPIADGTDAVYRVAGADGDYVLKAAQFVEPPRFRVKPRMLGLVAARTSIPVPPLVGFVDAHDELPAPFFLTKYVRRAYRQEPPRRGPRADRARRRAISRRVTRGRRLRRLRSATPRRGRTSRAADSTASTTT